MGSALQTMGRIYRTFPGKLKFAAVILLTIFLAGAELFVFYALRYLMDSVLNQDYSLFGTMVAVLVGVTVLNALFRYLRNLWAGSYGETGTKILRSELARHTVNMPIRELDQRHTGDMLTRMSNDMNLVRTFVSQTLPELIFNPLAAIGALALLFFLDWKLTVITLVIVPVVFVLSGIFSGPVGRYTKSLQEKVAVLNSQIQDTVTGMEIIRAFNMQKTMGEKFTKTNKEVAWNGVKLVAARGVLVFVQILAGMSPFLVCFGLGGYWAVKGEMSPGEVVAFINLLNPLTGPIAQMPVLLGQLAGQTEGAKRIFEIIDLGKERTDGHDFTPLNQGTVVAVKELSFGYKEEGEPVLCGVSFELKAGEKVAIVGPSGSGKTTVLKLLLGYYDTYGGAINIYNHDLKEWNLRELRKHMSLVSQDTYLFPGTLTENIAYGQLSAPKAAIETAAKEANAHEFISQFEHGYETNAGEFGDKLSGGQKQRIAIARAILKGAPILLLDEATSSLDAQSEFLVQSALNEYMVEGKTALIIAHRLSTIQKADRILVLDKGRIVETGSHAELLQKDGVYKKLYLRQLAAQNNDQLAKEAAV